MNDKHTPEPWRYLLNLNNSVTDDGYHFPYLVYAGAEFVAQVAADRSREQSPDEATARRIVACVNACEGILDTELSHGPVMAAHRRSYLVNEREELKKQRDELLAAMTELRKQIREHVKLDVKKHYSLMVADAAAGAAIANAKGK